MYQDEEKSFDIRILEKHFPVDKLSREQVNHYLEKLPDVTEKIDHDYHFSFTSPRRGYDSLNPQSNRKENTCSEIPPDQHSSDPEKLAE
ncbi:MAG TPA: hypothetical protein PKL48_10200 [Thermodesulfobacteriota bacterium]|nr:hypothetical protein [Deltaproteobacteria bacterium]HNU72065.1 hypothetical protein [Thermodesulfobacteriota bacterium]